MKENRGDYPPTYTADLDTIQAVLAEQLQPHQEIRFAILYGSAAEGRAFHDLEFSLVVHRFPKRRSYGTDLILLMNWSNSSPIPLMCG